MKRLKLVFPLLLTTAMLSACSNDSSPSVADKIKTEVADGIETDMNKAINDAKADMSEIKVDLKDGGKASIAANGGMTIAGKAVTLNEQQRALSKSYYDAAKKVAVHGIEIGKESAKLATQAIGSAIGSIFNGEKEADIDKKIKAKTGSIKAAAQKLCDSAMEMQVIQEKLAAAVPEFTPEPMEVVTTKDGCSVNSSDTQITADTGSDKALTAEEAVTVAAPNK